MSTKTAISWTDYSSNPVKYRDNDTGKTVWACVKKSAGCANCYAETLALRWGKGRHFSRPNLARVTPFLDQKEMARLMSEKTIPRGAKVFVGDMTDIFGSWVPVEFHLRLWRVFAQRHDVTFQVLTKRPERMAAIVSKVASQVADEIGGCPWPLPNVWLGTSVEDQRAADARIPHLLQAPAAVRFLSCEPLLGPVDLRSIPDPSAPGAWRFDALAGGWYLPASEDGAPEVPGDGPDMGGLISWCIAGGESGPGYRQMDVDWLRSLVGQCQEAGVAVWVKQDSHVYPGRQGRIPDAMYVQQFPNAAVPT